MSLAGKRVFITGGSRGIGLEIAKRIAKDGAHIAIAAKTADPNPKLPGTIYSAAQEIEAAGGSALPLVTDIRDEEAIASSMAEAVGKFGGLDILINNASAINLTRTEETPAKRFDLMFDVNVRGTFLTSQAAIPHLRNGNNPHILTLSPPLNMKEKWFKNHVAYTMSKYGMSMCVLGMSGEFKRDGVAVNALWPATAIKTAALQMIPGVDTNFCRTPEIMADAAYIILNKDSKSATGNFYIDEELLRAEGVTDFDQYSVIPGTKDFIKDFFLD
jgi:citronellol/citronellal dehydrogenase